MTSTTMLNVTSGVMIVVCPSCPSQLILLSAFMYGVAAFKIIELKFIELKPVHLCTSVAQHMNKCRLLNLLRDSYPNVCFYKKKEKQKEWKRGREKEGQPL
jgi:hypothetical protein